MFKIDGIISELSGNDGVEGAIDTGSELLDNISSMATNATLLVVIVASLVLYRSVSVIPVAIYEAHVAVMAAVVVVLSTTMLLTMVGSILLADTTMLLDVTDIDLLEESSEALDIIVTLQDQLH